MVDIDFSTYPLTFRWQRFIRGFSLTNQLPLLDCLQESFILEWELKEKQNSITKVNSYFIKVLRQRLVNLLLRQHAKNIFFVSDMVEEKEEQEQESLESNLFDWLICVRPFDEIYHEELITHVKVILLEIDMITAEMFIFRVVHNMKWKDIYEEYYPSMPSNKYDNRIKIIKDVVCREICFV